MPDEFEPFLTYLETYFGIERKEYVENQIESEIKSRNKDLQLF